MALPPSVLAAEQLAFIASLFINTQFTVMTDKSYELVLQSAYQIANKINNVVRFAKSDFASVCRFQGQFGLLFSHLQWLKTSPPDEVDLPPLEAVLRMCLGVCTELDKSLDPLAVKIREECHEFRDWEKVKYRGRGIGDLTSIAAGLTSGIQIYSSPRSCSDAGNTDKPRLKAECEWALRLIGRKHVRSSAPTSEGAVEQPCLNATSLRSYLIATISSVTESPDESAEGAETANNAADEDSDSSI
nr:uncharacterized protein CTRU02_05603 [Colletotrichum truncatum]KAF6794046.1 hypothetical protein CTRU02_05603 [Colletotrichum truncatum]